MLNLHRVQELLATGCLQVPNSTQNQSHRPLPPLIGPWLPNAVSLYRCTHTALLRQTQTVRGTSDGRAEGMRIVKQQQEEEQHMEFTALMKKHALRCAESTEEA